jgi:hypothetical protein
LGTIVGRNSATGIRALGRFDPNMAASAFPARMLATMSTAATMQYEVPRTVLPLVTHPPSYGLANI